MPEILGIGVGIFEISFSVAAGPDPAAAVTGSGTPRS
jgi:hypothetical protein